MDAYTSIQNNLNKRLKLLEEAKALEEMANNLRNEASTNNLNCEIKVIQNEIIMLLDRLDLLNNLLSLVCKLYRNLDDQIIIPVQDYYNCKFQGKSIWEIENELVYVTERIVILCSLLDSICGYIDHDYKFIKVDNIFDFEGLEITFEEKEIYYCATCGCPAYLDVDGEKKVDSSLNIHLEKLRRARKIQLYESKFVIEGNLHR